MLRDSLMRNSPSVEKNTAKVGKAGGKKVSDIPQKMIRLLAKMISTKKFSGSTEYQYDVNQIDEKILKYKINLAIPEKDSGFLLLRIAITAGRRDVCKVLLKHGASQLASDKNGRYCCTAHYELQGVSLTRHTTSIHD